MNETKQTAVYFAGINAETFDRPDEPTADADGHIINATILRREEAVHSLIPAVRRGVRTALVLVAGQIVPQALDQVDKAFAVVLVEHLARLEQRLGCELLAHARAVGQAPVRDARLGVDQIGAGLDQVGHFAEHGRRGRGRE